MHKYQAILQPLAYFRRYVLIGQDAVVGQQAPAAHAVFRITLTGFHNPDIFTRAFAKFFDMALTAESHDGGFAYTFDLKLELQDAYLIDLGVGADQAGVTLPINRSRLNSAGQVFPRVSDPAG